MNRRPLVLINNVYSYRNAGDSAIVEALAAAVMDARPDAEVVLQSHREEPVLAFRRFGLGRTGALTTDLGQRWSTTNR